MPQLRALSCQTVSRALLVASALFVAGCYNSIGSRTEIDPTPKDFDDIVVSETTKLKLGEVSGVIPAPGSITGYGVGIPIRQTGWRQADGSTIHPDYDDPATGLVRVPKATVGSQKKGVTAGGADPRYATYGQ